MSLDQPSLAQRIPDLPRWVEARATLLWECGEVYGLREAPELSLVVREPEVELVMVIGTPDAEAIREAVRANARGGTVIAPLDQAARLADALPDWTGTRAILHLPGPSLHLPEIPPDGVRFLDPAALDGLDAPDELLRELRSGAQHSPVAAAFADEKPVAFCYAGAITESLWDVSIDTLDGHRRRGYAALAAAYLIRHMDALGKRAVWGAVEENPASWRLAEKLGFVPVDELALFEPREDVELEERRST
jgi:RimJ/RimL family protein N-acetyltransferase